MERPRDHCIRCGECCSGSSPTLHMEDLALLKKGLIRKRNLYTIRVGEQVRDNVHEELTLTRKELIKVKEKVGSEGTCVFYDEIGNACTIYKHRPAQCAALKCWDRAEFMQVYNGLKLARKDIIDHGVLLGLIEAHEKRCGYPALEKHVKQIESRGDEALAEILDALRFEYQLRPFVSAKLGLDPEEMDFFFGRSLTQTIKMFGLKVVREPDGSFMLTTL